MTGWMGYFAPAGTPRAIIDRLVGALAEVCREPEVIKVMAELSVEPICGTPEEVAAAIAADLPVYRAAAEAAGLRRK